MTGNNILLDSNIVIELFKGNAAVMDKFETVTIVNIPFIVLGELYLGAYRSSDAQKHIRQINAFLNRCRVIDGDEQTAETYARIKTALLKKGKPIPENDIWIAAIAIQHGCSLVSRDGHFDHVEDLSKISW